MGDCVFVILDDFSKSLYLVRLVFFFVFGFSIYFFLNE